MNAAAAAASHADDPTVPLTTLLNRIAIEQKHLGALVLALQDLVSPQSTTASYGSDAIRGLQSIDLVTQTLNDLARMTHALADAIAHPQGPQDILLGHAPNPIAGSRPPAGAGLADREASARPATVPDTRPPGAGPGLATGPTMPSTLDANPAAAADMRVATAKLRAVLTLGDLAARVLGVGMTESDEEDDDVFWLGELAAAAPREGAA